ncbi:alpha-tocopherol transfer protein-like isoform X2 [Anabrus simplex]|uniref:alpha-tocopherol transfer protein-like isoform X2 n=1 Tax=Anabrus simplex TaxID=316456 RepID=UPI0035A33C17
MSGAKKYAQDDRLLRNMLIFRKNRLEKVKETIDLMYSVKTCAPEFLGNRDPLDSDLQIAIDSIFCYPFPKLTPEGSRVVFFKALDPNPEIFDFSRAVKLTLMAELIATLEDTCLNAVIVIDFRGASLAHTATMTLPLVKKFLFIAQKAFPIRPKAIHILYARPLVGKIYPLFKPFLKKKIADRVHIHSGGLGDIFEHIPQSMFPEDYGGNEPPTEVIHESWKKKLIEFRDWYLADDKLLVDEAKRPGKPKSFHDMFGFEGSFRQLSVD